MQAAVLAGADEGGPDSGAESDDLGDLLESALADDKGKSAKGKSAKAVRVRILLRPMVQDPQSFLYFPAVMWGLHPLTLPRRVRSSRVADLGFLNPHPLKFQPS